MTRNTNASGFSLKDHLFNKKKIRYLAGLFQKADTTFDADAFVIDVMKDLPHLPLKQRIVCIAHALEQQLPKSFEDACAVLVRALPSELDLTKSDDDFGDFIYAPLGEYIVRNGLSEQYVQTSLDTLKEITKRFSMEDSIRYFLNAFPRETLQRMHIWTGDSHYHVRRLVSEGTRPLLPWSGRVALSTSQTVPLLDILYADTTRYVTRSVANHLNDIAKTDPDLVLTTLARWHKAQRQEEKELAWMTRHALRTLIKQGNVGALTLLGYHPSPAIDVSTIAVNCDSLSLGDALEFSFTITAQRDEKLMVDYVIDFVKANGQTKQKVFKLKKCTVKKGETYTFSKIHRLPSDATTFTLYPGTHRVSLQINGKRFNVAPFELT